jgi:hypothetical protein
MLKGGAAKLQYLDDSTGLCGPGHPVDQNQPAEARQFEYRPSQSPAARARGPGGAR